VLGKALFTAELQEADANGAAFPRRLPATAFPVRGAPVDQAELAVLQRWDAQAGAMAWWGCFR